MAPYSETRLSTRLILFVIVSSLMHTTSSSAVNAGDDADVTFPGVDVSYIFASLESTQTTSAHTLVSNPTSTTTTGGRLNTTRPFITLSTTTRRPTTPEPEETSNEETNLGLILGLALGLALGLGVPAILAIIGGVVFYVKKSKRFTKKNRVDIEMTPTSRDNNRVTTDDDATF